MNAAEAIFALDEAEFLAGQFDYPASWYGLTHGQQRALETIRSKVGRQPVISLDGAGGTGKTTALRALADLLGRGTAVVVAPTNKAASVLQSKGVPAATLFARFFTLVEVSKSPKKMTFEPNDRMKTLGEGKISYAPVVIVDEASMLTTWALHHLRRMCDTLILVGDGNQLPPIGDREAPRGYFCTRQHDATLTEVLRNDGAVLKLASAIRVSPDGCALAGVDLDDYFPDDDFELLFVLYQPQLVCWRNVVRRSLNIRARQVLGRSSVLPVPGDLMLCQNNYSETLLNGTQCVMEYFSWSGSDRLASVTLRLPDGEKTVAYLDMLHFFKDQLPAQVKEYANLVERFTHLDEEGAALTYGYALTAHSAQGGEWPVVAVVDERAGIREMGRKQFAEDPKNLPPDEACRRWAYTAVSRAKETVYVVNERWTKH